MVGLINNVLYVIILSAALDLVGPSLPKAIVLLADVMPSFGTKLLAPYFVHLLPYRLRIPLMAAISFVGMQMVAWAEELPVRLFGVVLASVASGLGELSFLGMTHFYGPFAVPFWGSGTGAAGLLGAGMYVWATSWIGWSVRGSLMVFGFLPLIMLFAFFFVLPLAPISAPRRGYEPLADADADDADVFPADEASTPLRASHAPAPKLPENPLHGFAVRLARTKHLFLPYMLPLLIVYIGEYTINLGISPTLLFPLPETPFEEYRSFYPFYNTIYQAGVFISRSSTPFIRIRALYPPSLLQLVNLVILLTHAMTNYIPNVYIVFVVVFWEGLLGGLVYVNTFEEISEAYEGEEREFCLGAATVSDSAGICIAGFISLALEPWLCGYQVARGREYCRLT